jgi:sorbitol-specific phosphotransferase system component IIC
VSFAARAQSWGVKAAAFVAGVLPVLLGTLVLVYLLISLIRDSAVLRRLSDLAFARGVITYLVTMAIVAIRTAHNRRRAGAYG